MEITQVRVFPVEEDKLKAFVSIVLDECFVVSDIKIIQGANGLFVSMPSKRSRNGSFRDIAHPLNNETRRMIEERIVGEYRRVVADLGGEASVPVRRLEDADGAEGGEADVPRATFRSHGYTDPPFDHRGG
jgi:stage V sporulation protein G